MALVRYQGHEEGGLLDPDYDSGDYYLGWFVIDELVEFSADPDVIARCQAATGDNG